LDTERCVQHRLYRQHADQTGPVFVKDLSRLGRDLKRTIIVDNVAQNFQRQPENGIHIRSWFDDQEDQALYELGPILQQIADVGYDDLRVGLQDVIGGS